MLVAEPGRRLRLDSTHTHEYGRKGAKDRDQLQFAAGEGRVLITGNGRDFVPYTLEYQRLELPHAGVLCVPPPLARRPAIEIVRALVAFAHEHPAGLPADMHDNRHRSAE